MYRCRYAAFFGHPPGTQKSQLIAGKVTENHKRIFRCVTGRYLPHFVRLQKRLALCELTLGLIQRPAGRKLKLARYLVLPILELG